MTKIGAILLALLLLAVMLPVKSAAGEKRYIYWVGDQNYSGIDIKGLPAKLQLRKVILTVLKKRWSQNFSKCKSTSMSGCLDDLHKKKKDFYALMRYYAGGYCYNKQKTQTCNLRISIVLMYIAPPCSKKRSGQGLGVTFAKNVFAARKSASFTVKYYTLSIGRSFFANQFRLYVDSLVRTYLAKTKQMRLQKKYCQSLVFKSRSAKTRVFRPDATSRPTTSKSAR